MAAIHSHPVRVYYEDTDAGGIVYHANYLKFTERARSEWVRDLGVDQAALRATRGISIVVRRIEADYLRPALYDDLLRVTSELKSIGGARLDMEQVVLRGEEVLFRAQVTLVCIGPKGRVLRLPDELCRVMLPG